MCLIPPAVVRVSRARWRLGAVHLEVGQHAVDGGKLHLAEIKPGGTRLDVLVVHATARTHDEGDGEEDETLVFVTDAEGVGTDAGVTRELLAQRAVDVILRASHEFSVLEHVLDVGDDGFDVTRHDFV